MKTNGLTVQVSLSTVAAKFLVQQFSWSLVTVLSPEIEAGGAQINSSFCMGTVIESTQSFENNQANRNSSD